MSVCSIVNITELIDRCPLRPMQIRVIVLCGLVALLDGLDLLAIGVAAPVMAGPLHIAPNQLGFVFSAALVGLMLGAFGLGPIADRYGRRCVLIYATATFGVFTLCTASAATLQQILLFRFLAGVGLGGSMPSFTSLAAEYTPRSNRQAVIGLLWTGFPLGGVMVGLLASRLINAVGWPSLFYIGGILPLGLSIVLIRALPDSIEFLVMRGAARRDIRDLVMRICPTVDIASGCQFVIDDERTRGVPVSPLFSAGMVGGTVLQLGHGTRQTRCFCRTARHRPARQPGLADRRLLCRTRDGRAVRGSVHERDRHQPILRGRQSRSRYCGHRRGALTGLTSTKGLVLAILHLHDENASPKSPICLARRLRRSEFSHHVLSAPKMGANHRALRRACQLFSRAFRVLEVRSRTAPRRLFRYLPRAFEKLEQ